MCAVIYLGARFVAKHTRACADKDDCCPVDWRAEILNRREAHRAEVDAQAEA